MSPGQHQHHCCIPTRAANLIVSMMMRNPRWKPLLMDPRFNTPLQDQETIVVDILSNPRSRNAVGGINYLKLPALKAISTILYDCLEYQQLQSDDKEAFRKRHSFFKNYKYCNKPELIEKIRHCFYLDFPECMEHNDSFIQSLDEMNTSSLSATSDTAVPSVSIPPNHSHHLQQQQVPLLAPPNVPIQNISPFPMAPAAAYLHPPPPFIFGIPPPHVFHSSSTHMAPPPYVPFPIPWGNTTTPLTTTAAMPPPLGTTTTATHPSTAARPPQAAPFPLPLGTTTTATHTTTAARTSKKSPKKNPVRAKTDTPQKTKRRSNNGQNMTSDYESQPKRADNTTTTTPVSTASKVKLEPPSYFMDSDITSVGNTPSAGSTTSSQNTSSQNGDPKCTPQNIEERHAVASLQAMSFTDAGEILTSFRRLQSQQQQLRSSDKKASQNFTTPIPLIDEIMIDMITQREEAEEIRKMDAARLLSEQTRKDDAKRRRDAIEHEYRTSIEQCTSIDILLKHNDSRLYGKSWILNHPTIYNIMKRRITVNVTPLKLQLLTLLQLEKNAQKWYGTILPRSYFVHYLNERLISAIVFDEALEDDDDIDITSATNDCDDNVDDGDDSASKTHHFASQMQNEITDLQNCMYDLSQQVGGVPKAFRDAHDEFFLNTSQQKHVVCPNGNQDCSLEVVNNGIATNRSWNNHQNDDDDNISVTLVPTPSPFATPTTAPPTTATTTNVTSGRILKLDSIPKQHHNHLLYPLASSSNVVIDLSD